MAHYAKHLAGLEAKRVPNVLGQPNLETRGNDDGIHDEHLAKR
jgi:hypothetical protein